MADLFRTASDWLTGQRHQYATSQVVYRRGDRTVELNATIGRTQYEQDDGYGVVMRAEARDYIVRAIDLALDGVQTTPEVGDRIEETMCGNVYVYEVLPIGSSEQHWRHADPFRQTMRIHTKLVSQGDA